MKYLKLYEAFSSNTLSKLYRHLRKNVTKSGIVQFKEDIELMANKLDIPMDKISDEDVAYLSRKKALPMRGEAKNDSGIWAIKFWFDKDGEYIGSSGTGNSTFDSSLASSSGTRHSKPYSKEQWDKIKKSMTYGFPKNGYLTPVLGNEYGKLKSGDQVIACLCDEDEYEDYPESRVDRLVCGKIFVDEDGSVYMIHDDDIAEGMWPDDHNPLEEYPEIEWGEYGWRLADSNKRVNSDHFNLHKVSESDTPLAYYAGDKREESGDPFEFNVSLEETEDDRLVLSSWLGNADEKKRIEKDADFSVILYIDEILGRGLQSPSATSAGRKQAREGAVALMSEEDFKKANIDKYIEVMVKKMGITAESVELRNLEKVVAAIMSSGTESYSLFAVQARDFRAIDDFSYQIRKLVSGVSVPNSEAMMELLYREFLKEYTRFKKGASFAYKNRKVAMDMLKQREELRPLYDAIMRVSAKISKGILSREITRGEDLKKIYFKLDSVDNMVGADEFRLTEDLRRFFEDSRYAATDSGIVKVRLDRLEGEYITEKQRDNLTRFESDMKALEEIESYIDDIFGK